MAKPAITKRVTKGSALTYSELDTNFQNLADATIALTAGTGGTQVISDLNGNITLVAGTNITLTGNNTTKQITIASTASTNSFVNIDPDVNDTVVADSNNDTLRLAGGAGITTSGNATSDSISIAVDDDQFFQTLTNSTAGASINFMNGSIITSRYSRRRGWFYTNTSTPTVDLTYGRTVLPQYGTIELPIAISSLTLTLDTSSADSFEMIRLIFDTTTGGGTFTISANTTVYWADGNKTCTRDGSCYMIEIQNRGVTGGTNGDVYYARLTRYAT